MGVMRNGSANILLDSGLLWFSSYMILAYAKRGGDINLKGGIYMRGHYMFRSLPIFKHQKEYFYSSVY